MQRRIVIITIDGGSPEYFEKSDIPNIRQMIKEGFYVEGNSIIPSVTNVNNISIITGSFPSEHGITSNYWYTPQTSKGVYMESPEFVMKENIFEIAGSKGMKSAVLTSKDKLKRMLEVGTNISFSAEHPPKKYIEEIGQSEKIYSAEINYWLFNALRYVVKNHPDISLMYASTTDYIMHKYSPEEEESLRHLAEIDHIIGLILDENPDLEIYITADHGMNVKTTALNLSRYLLEAGIRSVFVPAIKDRYTIHHNNLGGVGYIHIISEENTTKSDNSAEILQAIAVLKEIEGIEEVFTADEAADCFGLHKDRIGDIMVLGEKHCVFGDLENKVSHVSIRSHGSRHESRIPIIGYNSPVEPGLLKNSLDIVRYLDL